MWCVLMCVFCASFVIYLIWTAFPWLHQWGPKNSSDLASWVQAVGVIIALWISIWLANLPRRHAVEASVSQAKAFAIISYKYLMYLREICPKSHEDAFRLYASLIRDLMNTNVNLNYATLPSSILAYCYEFRCLNILVEEYSKILETTKDPDVLLRMYDLLNGASDEIDKSLKIIIFESNKILKQKDDFDEVKKMIEIEMRRSVKMGQAI